VDKFGGILRNNQKKKENPKTRIHIKIRVTLTTSSAKEKEKGGVPVTRRGIRALYDIIRLMMEAIGDSRL
jgi:hypothetical protein